MAVAVAGGVGVGYADGARLLARGINDNGNNNNTHKCQLHVTDKLAKSVKLTSRTS